ncbi:long-chain-fatty-acid--CoA ligase [Halorhodospira halophila]|uniref:Long-chain-fatty-acid--CoA ligase n=1 Tax=Halorhodospira halophila (strain DSM 244 / SL1) TaxID=349124 RepID=A1WZ61_HALHL|nr:long-chain fatty acid--CoA ligase [Halorhodospira halophila]ABM62973.1 AMP-dependent synthetase and ligase [Halorhodospira halophila SL1]MBK1727906.1 long-chain fatty acid--CoA ligase [Halorhodospira halophila]
MTDQGHAAFYDARPWERCYGTPPDQEPMLQELGTVADIARRRAEQSPHLPAYTACLENGLNATLDFATVDRLADCFAAWLMTEAGIRPGDRVAVQMPNALPYPVAVFGTLRAGAVLVNINPLFTPREMQHQLQDSGARVLVIVDLFADKLPGALTGTAVEEVVLSGVADLFPWLKRGLVHGVLRAKREIPASPQGTRRLGAVLARGERLGPQPWPERSPDDLALLQYTGGTTGLPKGAELRNRNILANLEQIKRVAGDAIRPGEDVVLTALPLYHIFAFTFNLLTFHHYGCRNILCPSPRPVDKLRKAFEQFPVSKFSAVNLLFYGLLQAEWFQKNPPQHLDFAIAGGTALHRSTAEQWQSLLGHTPLEGYGLTETSPVLAVNPPHGENRLGSVGVPLPGTDVRIVDDDDRPVPQGQTGEIVGRGPQVFEGYWQRPEENRQTLRGGWFHTGDIGYMDPDGYIYIVDRKKDMIDVSGFNVYPNEVEEALAEHPAVAEVAVVGAPRGEAGQAVIAFVVTPEQQELAESELLDFARQQLTHYKVPRRVVFRDALPKSAVGKLLRRDLREEARAIVEASGA